MKNVKKMIIGSLAATLLVGCATAAPTYGQINPNGMTTISNTQMDTVQFKKNANYAGYSKIYVAPVSLDFVQDKNEYQLSDKNRVQLINAVGEIFTGQMDVSSGLDVVAMPGRDTLSLNLTITDFGLNIDKRASKINFSKTYSKSPGHLKINGTLVDSVSGEVLAVFEDYQKPETFRLEQISEISIKSDFRRIMKSWAKTVGNSIALSRSQ